MSESPNARVVIVTRTKDRPVLLRRAVASVLSQDFADWCQVIINDGGDPATVRAVVEPSAETYAGRLCLLDNAVNQGMEAASNRAIAESRSTYLVIHDDDDTWDPGFLSACVGFLDGAEHYGGVATRTRVVHERIEDDTVIRDGEEPFSADVRQITLARMLRANFMPPISFLYRRRCLEEVGGYRADLPVLGDWDFNVRFLMRFDIALLDRALAYYHLRPQTGGILGNSGEGGHSRHREYEARLRNNWLRQALGPDPGLVGLLANSADAVSAERILDVLQEAAERQIHLVHVQDAAFRSQQEVRRILAEELLPKTEALRQRTEELRQREDEIRRLNDQIQSLMTSTSWKVSAPVRWVGRLFSRGAPPGG